MNDHFYYKLYGKLQLEPFIRKVQVFPLESSFIFERMISSHLSGTVEGKIFNEELQRQNI